MNVIKPPVYYTGHTGDKTTIFLAGSIEMGSAEPWQDRIVAAFYGSKNIVFFNPRREDWDSSWEQSANNNKFRQQVEWELDHLSDSDIILMYFSPGTKSPILLLELGLFAESGKIIVCCPEGFLRKGNVDIVCDRYKITQVPTIESAIKLIKDEYD